jgi:MFS family permease
MSRMYYSTAIFEAAGFERSEALLTSMGMGLVNWLFALPAFYTIDTFGRRNLLLVTFPLMALSLIFTAFSFLIPAGTGQLACVATGIYIFAAVYSPGAGPVPFTYCAEAFPLHIRVSSFWIRSSPLLEQTYPIFSLYNKDFMGCRF